MPSRPPPAQQQHVWLVYSANRVHRVITDRRPSLYNTELAFDLSGDVVARFKEYSWAKRAPWYRKYF